MIYIYSEAGIHQDEEKAASVVPNYLTKMLFAPVPQVTPLEISVPAPSTLFPGNLNNENSPVTAGPSAK